MRSVAAVILAAGRASRFGAGPDDSKVLAPLDGRSLVRHVAETALASRADRTFVVTGQAAGGVVAALAGLAVTPLPNPAYASGMASSLAVGLTALPATIDGALVLLADMPRVAVATLDALIVAYAANEPVPDAVVPVHAGRRGNPVLIGRALFADVARLRGDEGARRLLAQPGRRVVACPVEDPGIAVDVDTRAALRALVDTRAALRALGSD